MSSKKVKVALKLAKQEIQKKNFEGAITHCNEVLDSDPHNYNAHVFLGLSYAELSQLKNSLESYHSAIKLSPDEVLAYHGLGNLFTKHWKGNLTKENIKDKIFAYENLMRLTDKSNADKILDIITLLSKSYCQVENYKEAIKILQENSEIVKSCENNETFLKSVIDVIVTCKNHGLELKEYFQFIFQSVVQYCDLPDIQILDKENALKSALLISPKIFPDSFVKDLVETCQEMLKSDSQFPMDILVQIQLQNGFDNLDISLDTYNQHISNYNGLYKDILHAYNFYKKGKQSYQQIVELLEKGLKVCPDFLPAYTWLNKGYIYLHQYFTAQDKTRLALQLCKSVEENKVTNITWLVKISKISEIKIEIMKCEAEGLSNSNDLLTKTLAIDVYEKLIAAKPNCIPSLIGISRLMISLNKLEDAAKYLEIGQNLVNNNPVIESLTTYLHFLKNDQVDVITELSTLCQENPNCFDSHFYLAKIMWKKDEAYRKDKSKCLATFLKAAKLEPYNAECFLYIGHYYRDISKDLLRAKKCYQKCLDLDSFNDQAGAALADVLTNEGDFDSAILLYEKITNSSAPGGQKWPWLRLGLCRLKTKETTSAITCFQAALRADASDYICWECLGEGYLNRGSYTAAWKSFSQAHKLNPSSVYTVYQMAAIKQLLGYHNEAIEKYFEVLRLKENYVPALKGLGECYCSLARQMLSEGRYLSCVDQIQQAINHLCTAVYARSDLSCIWKLLGDSCTMFHPLHTSNVKLSVPTGLGDEKFKNSAEVSILGKYEVLQLGSVMYSRALFLNQTNGLLWHDLGLNYFYQSKENKSSHLAAKSVSVLQKALQYEANNHLIWNTLGVVAASEYVQNKALAQHCFITSIQHDPNNCKAWNNLATLYIQQSEIKLAHKAFKVAQSLEPSFINAWIGQAHIAEIIGSEESYDLFQHSVSLSLHEQASAGYADMVCKTLTKNNNKTGLTYSDNLTTCNTLSLSVEQLSKYTNKYPDCEWAASMHGMVLEKCGHNNSSETAYLNCLNILKSQNASTTKLNKARSNYARILCKNHKYKESISIYKEIGSDNCDVYELCGFGLNLFYLKEFQSALGVYDQAIELSSNKNDQVFINCAKSIVLWNMGNKKQALSELCSCDDLVETTQLQLAMAILTNDKTTTENLLEKLNKDCNLVENPENNLNCLLTINAFMILDQRKAIVLAQKFVHRFPYSFQCRELLTKVILTQPNINVSQTLTQSTSMLHNHNKDDTNLTVNKLLPVFGENNKHKNIMMLNALVMLASGSHSHKDNSTNKKDSLKSAQRLAHLYPYNTNSLMILSCACYAKAVLDTFVGCKNSSKLLDVCLKLSSYLTNQTQCSSSKDWMTIQQVLTCVVSKKYEKAVELISNLKCETSTSDMLSTLCELCQEIQETGDISKESTNEIQNLVNSRSATTFTLKVCSFLFGNLGLNEKSYSALEKLNQKVDQNLHLQMAFIALQLAESNLNEKEKWCKIVNENLNKVENRNDIVCQLVDGLCYKVMENKRKQKVALNRVLNFNSGGDNLCKIVAAWHLYVLYHDKNDEVALQDLVEKWEKFDTKFLEKIRSIYPN